MRGSRLTLNRSRQQAVHISPVLREHGLQLLRQLGVHMVSGIKLCLESVLLLPHEGPQVVKIEVQEAQKVVPRALENRWSLLVE